MRRTQWNDDLNGYAVRLCENETLNLYEDKVEAISNLGQKIIRSVDKYIGGNIIELLAEYEDTGLTPEEIRELKYIDLKKLQESNRILRENNDEYFKSYQKLFDENYLLKKLLKDLLAKEVEE